MPIFDYVCENCRHEILDVFQKFDEPTLIYCPQCGEETLKKQLGRANFQLKGDGWYRPSPTDEKSESE